MPQDIPREVSPSWFTVILGLILALIYGIVHRAYPRPIPGIPHNELATQRLAGDLVELWARQRPGVSFRSWFLEQAPRHGSAITQIFLGPFAKPAVLLSDYWEVHDILTRRESEFKRGKKVDVFRGIIPHAHASMESFDPRFRSSRGLLNDLMTPSFLNKVSLPLTYEVTTTLVQLWKLKAQMSHGRPFNVVNDITEFSFDAIISAAMGIETSGGSLETQLSFLRTNESAIPPSEGRGSPDKPVEIPIPEKSASLRALEVDEESLWKGFYMPSPWLYHRINKCRGSVRNAGQTMRSHINSRIANAVMRLDRGDAPECALDYVIQREIRSAQNTGRQPVLDDPRIRDGIYGYLIAGHDTSTGTLVWLLRILMKHSREQTKIRDDLRATYTEAWNERRLPTASELVKKAPYTEAFIEEVLRLNSPVVTIVVVTRMNTTILGHAVPKDTPVFLNLTGPSLSMQSVHVPDAARSEHSRLHRGARVNWDDFEPQEFRPERWINRDRDGKIVFNGLSGPILSFSAGDRGCWGKRLGYLELRIALTLLIWTFHFDEVPEELSSWETYDSLVTAPKQCFIRPGDCY